MSTPTKISKSKEAKITFLDLETTDKNPHGAEILTAFLRTRRVDDFSIIDQSYLTFRPEKYLDESYEIHKISAQECMSFDNKWHSFRKLLGYMYEHGDGLFCCHANHLVFGVHGYFDEQVIRQVSFLRSVDTGKATYGWYMKQRFKFISTHTIAKRVLRDLGKYRLNHIADHYGIKFNHHNAESDVKATEIIFRNMVDDQMSLEDIYRLGNYKESPPEGIHGWSSKQLVDL